MPGKNKSAEPGAELPVLQLRRGQEKRVLSGHPWVFSNELDLGRCDQVESGGLAVLRTSRGTFVATVYHNPATLIACRVLTRSRQVVDHDFFCRRIRKAIGLREMVYPGLDSMRLVFSESDFLPGLVVDRYGHWLSVQILTAGMEKLRDTVLDALQEELDPHGIVLCCDSHYRTMEGLSRSREVVAGEYTSGDGEGGSLVVEIEQNGCRFAVDLLGGQKTGFFLDQRENREFLTRLVRSGDTVADICCYTGSWAIKSALLGAGEVLGVDSSAPALKTAETNARLNDVGDRVEWRKGDAMKTARELLAAGRLFDLVAMDPPPLARSRKGLTDAGRKYATMNAAVMRLVKPGGYLLTASCSHLIGREALRKILASAAEKSGRETRLLAWGGQAMDHPVLPGAPETEYLHFAVLKIN